ncbi:hypothetical protein KI387_038456, partial [Taxus chinensis]
GDVVVVGILEIVVDIGGVDAIVSVFDMDVDEGLDVMGRDMVGVEIGIDVNE